VISQLFTYSLYIIPELRIWFTVSYLLLKCLFSSSYINTESITVWFCRKEISLYLGASTESALPACCWRE